MGFITSRGFIRKERIMATSTRKKTVPVSENKNEANPIKVSAETSQEKPAVKKIVAKDIDLSTEVTVRNGFQGSLIYKSHKTGEKFEWDSFGDEQYMELKELKNAKTSSKKFFENNWFMFDEDWIVDFLGVSQYYKTAVKIEDFDNIFFMSPDDIIKLVSEMSSSKKRSVAYRARQLINEGKIDSIKTIKALEKALGISLIAED